MDLSDAQKWELMNMTQIIISILEGPRSVEEISGLFGSEEMDQREIAEEVKVRLQALEDKGLVSINGNMVGLETEIKDAIFAVEDMQQIGPTILKFLL